MNHGHFRVNGRQVDIPSYQVRPDDVISVKPGSNAEPAIRAATELVASVAPWLQADYDALNGKVLKAPERTEIDTPVQRAAHRGALLEVIDIGAAGDGARP